MAAAEVPLARIVIVHGIANQFNGERELRNAWLPALIDGLLLARSEDRVEPDDCSCPFYGDIFRPRATLGLNPTPNQAALRDGDESWRLLLEVVWREAVAADSNVPRPENFSNTLFRAPRFVERAMNSIAKSSYLANLIPLRFFGDLRQVITYFEDPTIRVAIQERVKSKLAPDTRIVIGHSLGSVIAYEVLSSHDKSVAFVTLGSPLGIRNVVFDKLVPEPN